ncbi:divergent polysaccharide deacetylase family protein [Pseudohoeflea sp. DP4N28-3]|uniref:Divergent polysaccharide deacetylase family protein n=1 Tax=Pseudohoeflea coraliihabitans TaxID=2860393 RepID=A0ABS6WL93_9HYPH|nr:divergent polysaccharide deacetylase family protein [Pseudohoeflea sp. DP4N28-3]MBW3096707.1 divergent polysaccharide deacetylase family protein [Pseudohoeflea sp. DP4N28-3]
MREPDIHAPLLGKPRREAASRRGQRGVRALPACSALLLVIAGSGWAAWQARIPVATQPGEATEASLDPAFTGTVPDPASPVLQNEPENSDQPQITIIDGAGASGDASDPLEENYPDVSAPPGPRGQDRRLAHLPDPAVLETTAIGKLPVLGAAGERAFDIYARPWSGARGTRIAILIGGLGLSQTGTQHALQVLPEEITVAFAANGNSLQRWMQQARRDGREIMLQVPFEPFDYPRNNPGRGTLTVDAGAERNLADLHGAMARITNYTGITNFMGGRFLASPEAMAPVMDDLAGRGLMFLDDGTAAQSLADSFAQRLAIPFAAADLVIDTSRQRGDILAQLDTLERIARRNGTAIGVGSAFEITVDTVASWTNEAKARGIEIVGVAALADDPQRN